MKTDKLRRLTAASLVLAFTLPQAAQAAAPTVETDESVYINMDYYGAPTNTRIVKGVSLNGHTEFTDFGSYADVYNMRYLRRAGHQRTIRCTGSCLTPASSASTTSASRPTMSTSRCRGTLMFPTS